MIFKKSAGCWSTWAAAILVSGSASFAANLTDNQPVTFTKDVAPILQQKCQDCHRAGSMAPMSLLTYEETRPWAKAIRERVITRQMPPWHIDRNVGVQKFKNDMSLSDAQIATIVRWVDSGSPWAIPKTCRLPGNGRPAMSGKPPRIWPAGSDHRSDTLHHACSSSGCVVAAGSAHPDH